MINLTRMGRLTAFAGAAAQLVGLGWNAVLHRLDPDLAAREGIFTLTNPGHVLFAGGLALVVAGIGLMLLAGGSVGRVTRYGAAAALAVVSLGALALAATSEGRSSGHSHAETLQGHEDGTSHTLDQQEASVQEQGMTDPRTAAGHAHPAAPAGAADPASAQQQHAADIPISIGDLTTLNGQLATARANTERYQDVREALKDGYIQVTQDLPLIAAHFINPRYALDGVFDPAQPEMLLYAKLDGRWTLVGLNYLMPLSANDAPPEGFAGPLDTWHYHTGLCFRGQSVISSKWDDAGCRQAGGRFVNNTGWMTHLWLYLESPEGLFAQQNSLLKGSGAILTRAELHRCSRMAVSH